MFNKNFTVYVGGLNTAIPGEYFAVFSHPYGELYCSDGTILEYRYNGVWDFILVKKGTQFDRIDPWIDETVDYSDNVHFNGQLEWVNILYKTYP